MSSVQITPECGPLVAREGDESSSTGDSSDSKCLAADAVRSQNSTRPASAPLPQLSDRLEVNDVSWLFRSFFSFFIH